MAINGEIISIKSPPPEIKHIQPTDDCRPSWWRHQMETFPALLAICAENSPAIGEFPAKRSVTRSFDVFFDLRRSKRLSKQSWGWWFETLSRPLWRHRNVKAFHRAIFLIFHPNIHRVSGSEIGRIPA